MKKMTTEELLSEVRSLRCENARLKLGGCRFNCRTQRDAFLAGWERPGDHKQAPIQAYEEWRKQK